MGKPPRFVVAALLAVLLIADRYPGAARAGAADAPAAKRVLIVSVDGLRPDLLLRCKTPNMHRLIEQGSFTFWAQTVAESYTLPSHVSMFTGVRPERHGVTWNNHIEEAYPQVPTLFTLAKKAGRTTALAVGKTKFVALTPPESLDWKFQPMDEPVPDERVAREAARMVREHRPEVLFVHFPGADDVGHAKGWGSPEQVKTIEQIDAALGLVLGALDDARLRESTLIILTADHGGMARAHDPDEPRARYIPWIAAGPGVRKNFDLNILPKFTVHIEDTFATACAWLGLDGGKQLNGKAVDPILEKNELLYSADPANGAAPAAE